MLKKSTQTSFLCLSLSLLAVSCGGDSVDRAEYDRIVAQNDSLAQQYMTQRNELTEINSYIGEISSCVDSIAEQEGVLLMNVDPETGRRLRRREIRENIRRLGEIINRQRAKIAELTDSFRTQAAYAPAAQVERLTSMIEFLNGQLEEKENQVHALQVELAGSRRDVASLTEGLNRVTEDNTRLTNENATLDQMVEEQGNRMHVAHVMVKTKQELKQLGIVSGGGLFRKSKYDPSAVNIVDCQEIDIRYFTGLPIPGRDAKLLSAAPEGSYVIEQSDGGGSYLRIVDTEAFWRLSRIVVIQYSE